MGVTAGIGADISSAWGALAALHLRFYLNSDLARQWIQRAGNTTTTATTTTTTIDAPPTSVMFRLRSLRSQFINLVGR